MRLTHCDRCPVAEEGYPYPQLPAGWARLLFGNGFDLCPACVKRALEKPGRDPVLDATDFPDVPFVSAPLGAAEALLQGKDIVLDSAHGDRDSG